MAKPYRIEITRPVVCQDYFRVVVYAENEEAAMLAAEDYAQSLNLGDGRFPDRDFDTSEATADGDWAPEEIKEATDVDVRIAEIESIVLNEPQEEGV
jgi:hypothetical protein